LLIVNIVTFIIVLIHIIPIHIHTFVTGVDIVVLETSLYNMLTTVNG